MNKERLKTLQTAEQSVTYQFQEFLIFVDCIGFFWYRHTLLQSGPMSTGRLSN